MTNLEKYTQAFASAFDVSQDEAKDLKYQAIQAWDSVGHMGLIAAIEEAFDIMMETEDIIDLSSYKKGKEILSEKYSIDFTQ